MKRQLRWIATAAALASLSLLGPGHALAMTPTTTVISLVNTRYSPGLSALCGFDVWVSNVGTLRITTFYDSAGNPVRDQLAWPDAKFTFSGNGNSVTSASPDPITFDYATGSTVTRGLEIHLTVPGQGTITLTAGLVVIDSGGNVTFEAGPDIGDISGICTALS